MAVGKDGKIQDVKGDVQVKRMQNTQFKTHVLLLFLCSLRNGETTDGAPDFQRQAKGNDVKA